MRIFLLDVRCGGSKKRSDELAPLERRELRLPLAHARSATVGGEPTWSGVGASSTVRDEASTARASGG